jgi:hypothetical protein
VYPSFVPAVRTRKASQKRQGGPLGAASGIGLSVPNRGVEASEKQLTPDQQVGSGRSLRNMQAKVASFSASSWPAIRVAGFFWGCLAGGRQEGRKEAASGRHL